MQSITVKIGSIKPEIHHNKKKQVNWPVSFNPHNHSHEQLMQWIEKQTTNRSSFIRETLMLRMMGALSRVEN